MGWKTSDLESVATDLDVPPATATQPRPVPPIAAKLEQEEAAGLVSVRRSARVKGLPAIEINPNEEVELPSGRKVRFVLRRLPREKCRVFHGNQRAFSALTKMDVEDILPTVRAAGIMNPVLARPAEEGGWEVIDGSRRLFAAGLVGLAELPAFTAEIEDADAYHLTASHNLYSKPTAWELSRFAAAALEAKDSPFRSQDELAQYLGISKGTLSKVLGLRDLPTFVTELLADPREIPLVTGYELVTACRALERTRAIEGLQEFCGRLGARGRSNTAEVIEAVLKEGRRLGTKREERKAPPRPSTVVDLNGRALFKWNRTPKGSIKVEFLCEEKAAIQMIDLLKKELSR